jgi:hypothetical protein
MPVGAAAGAIVGEIIGGGVCQPELPAGALVGITTGAVISSWRRLGDFELVRMMALIALVSFIALAATLPWWR